MAKQDEEKFDVELEDFLYNFCKKVAVWVTCFYILYTSKLQEM